MVLSMRLWPMSVSWLDYLRRRTRSLTSRLTALGYVLRRFRVKDNCDRWRELIGAPAVALCRSALPSPGARAQRVPWVHIHWELIIGRPESLGGTE